MIDAIRPYTYHLYHKLTKKHYYGVRWANKVNPEKDLWVEYFSSSKKVKIFSFKKKKDKVIRIKVNIAAPDKKNGFFNKHHSEKTKVRLSVNHLKYEYKLIDSNNKIYQIKNLLQFCKERDLDLCSLNAVVRGKYYQYKGWVGYIIGQEYLRKRIEEKHDSKLIFGVCSPDGIFYDEIQNVKIFCDDHYLNYKSFRCNMNKIKPYKNWQFFVKEK